MNIDIILYVLCGIVLVLAMYLIIFKQNVAIKNIALKWVIEAERTYGSGTGEIKYNYVVGAIYERIPFIFRVFFTEKMIDNIIENAVDYMKEFLGESKIQKV